MFLQHVYSISSPQFFVLYYFLYSTNTYLFYLRLSYGNSRKAHTVRYAERKISTYVLRTTSSCNITNKTVINYVNSTTVQRKCVLVLFYAALYKAERVVPLPPAAIKINDIPSSSSSHRSFCSSSPASSH